MIAALYVVGREPYYHCNYEAVWHNYKVMIPRQIQPQVSRLLEQFPAVAILGPRQVGKTTLATALAEALEHFHLRYIVDSAVTEPGLGVLWCDLG